MKPVLIYCKVHEFTIYCVKSKYKILAEKGLIIHQIKQERRGINNKMVYNLLKNIAPQSIHKHLMRLMNAYIDLHNITQYSVRM